MKKWLFVLLGSLLVVLAACGGTSDDAEEVETNEPQEEVVEENEEITDETEVEADEAEEAEEDEATEVAEGDVVEPEEIYKESCASCHSGDFDFGQGEVDLSVEEIEDLILNGIGNMPAIDVSEEEANALAIYLSSQE